MGAIVSFESGGVAAQGYLARPRAGSGPGLIVVQEWWGLVPHIEEVCDRFASDGFVALAPDLYHGATTTEPDEASKLLMELDLERAIGEIDDGISFLRSHDAATGTVGIVGFCMGGGLTFAAAAKANPDAAVPFYGMPLRDPGYADIRCPILAHFAEHDDPWASASVAQERIEQIAGNGVEATLHVYPGTGHAFFNDHRPEVYDKGAAETAYARTLDFLREHLT